MTQKEAAQLLGICTRQVKRLWRLYRKKGAQGIVSGRRGKPSNHRLDVHVVQQVLDLIKEKSELSLLLERVFIRGDLNRA